MCPNTHPATILVVEDNFMLRESMCELLESQSYRVMIAGNGVEALAKIKQDLPNIILCDVGMPEMDGFTFFQHVRENPKWTKIPIVFVTAHSNREDILRGKRMGAEDYLLKPFEIDELLSVLQAKLSRNQELEFLQLHNAYHSSLLILARAIELRDVYTHGHVERVTEYALSIGRMLNLSVTLLEELRFGGILHDIGKIHVSEAILRKPGKLTDIEWQEMRRHPILGAEMLVNIPYLYPSVPIIRSHHERWDGMGYPDRLIGEQTPLLARIVAVADSFDAITSNRSYRRGLGLIEGHREIWKGSGTAYDPQVVHAFEKIWQAGEVQAIFNQNQAVTAPLLA
jgi:putative two-component system response regulator